MLPYQMDASNLQVVPVQQAEPVQMQAQEIKPISVVQEPVEPQVPVEVPVPSPAAVKPAPVEEQKLTFIPRVASNQILPQQNDNVAKSTVAPLSAGKFDLQTVRYSSFCKIALKSPICLPFLICMSVVFVIDLREGLCILNPQIMTT